MFYVVFSNNVLLENFLHGLESQFECGEAGTCIFIFSPAPFVSSHGVGVSDKTEPGSLECKRKNRRVARFRFD